MTLLLGLAPFLGIHTEYNLLKALLVRQAVSTVIDSCRSQTHLFIYFNEKLQLFLLSLLFFKSPLFRVFYCLLILAPEVLQNTLVDD